MGSIGILTNDRHGVFQELVIAGVRDVMADHPYDVIIDSRVNNPDFAVTLDPTQVDGLVVIANAAPLEFIQKLHEQHKPLSLVSHQIPDLPVPAVVFNNAQGIIILVRHLVKDCQRRRIAFIGGIPEQYDAIYRESAFRQEVMRYELDIPDHFFWRGEFAPEIAIESLHNALKDGLEFDAILAADYLMAAAVAEQLRAAGMRVPQEVAVVGFGDAPEAERTGITTVAANVRELGQRAARQLISQMRGLRIRGVTTLSVQLIIRESSAEFSPSS